VYATQSSPVAMSGGYADSSCPPPGYILNLDGPTTVSAFEFSNGTTTASGLPWTPDTDILLGQFRLNDGNKWYYCRSPGTTASSGGPTGTATSGIIDGTVEWGYTGQTGDANVAKILVGNPGPTGTGSCYVTACEFPYNTTAITGLPIYDGNDNPIGAILGHSSLDYAKSVSHAVYGRGNFTALRGSTANEQLLDFDGRPSIDQRSQVWTDNVPDPDLAITRNDGKGYVVTVPYTAVITGTGTVTVAAFPKQYKITDCILDVTEAFAGSGGLSGITAKVGIDGGALDALLLAGNVESTTQYGLVSADRGAGWDGGRYLTDWTTSFPNQLIVITFAAGAGVLADLTDGSLTLYLETARLSA